MRTVPIQRVHDVCGVNVYSEIKDGTVIQGKFYIKTSDVAEIIWREFSRTEQSSFKTIEELKKLLSDTIPKVISGRRQLQQCFVEEEQEHPNNSIDYFFPVRNFLILRDAANIFLWHFIHSTNYGNAWNIIVSNMFDMYMNAFMYIDNRIVGETMNLYINNFKWLDEKRSTPTVTAQPADNVKTTEAPRINVDDIPSQKEQFESIINGSTPDKKPTYIPGQTESLFTVKELADELNSIAKDLGVKDFLATSSNILDYFENIKVVRKKSETDGSRVPTMKSLENNILFYGSYTDQRTNRVMRSKSVVMPETSYNFFRKTIVSMIKDGTYVTHQFIACTDPRRQVVHKKPRKKKADDKTDTVAHAPEAVKEEDANASTVQKIQTEEARGYDRTESYNRDD